MAHRTHIEVIYHTAPDILEIIYKDNSNDAFDEYCEEVILLVKRVQEQKKLDQPLYLIIDVSQSGMYSLDYATQRLEDIKPIIRDLPKAYFVYITDNYNEQSYVELFDFFPNSRQQDQRRVFGSDDRDNAIAWLLSNTQL